jgi:hypothetical protein
VGAPPRLGVLAVFLIWLAGLSGIAVASRQQLVCQAVLCPALHPVRLAFVILSPVAVGLSTLLLVDRFGRSRDVLGELVFLLLGSVVAVATGVLLLRLWPSH